MKNRIVALINKFNLTNSSFANAIGTTPTKISHIISGRNNPSLDMVDKILRAFPNVNYFWLVRGEGTMFIEDNNVSTSTGLYQQTLIDYSEENSTEKGSTFNSKMTKKAIKVEKPLEIKEITEADLSNQNKKVKKIIVLYTDETFAEYELTKI